MPTTLCLTLAIIVLNLHKGSSVTPGLVCPFGHFEISCKALNGTAIAWNITFPSEIEVTSGRLVITSTGPQSLQPLDIIDSTVILILRTSLSPLTSLLEINNTTTALNGTRIGCTTTDGTQSTVLTIIGNDNPVPQLQANVSVIDHHYSAETVTITLEWSQGEDILYDFTVLTSPQAEVRTNGTTSTRARLQLSYNTPYNVSVVTHCGQNYSAKLTTLHLHYVNCSDLPPNTTITNYSRPGLAAGTTAIVNCIRSNKTVVITCMDSGSWEPDPNERDLCLESTTASTDTSPGTSDSISNKAQIDSPTLLIIGVSLGILVALITLTLIAIFSVIAIIKYKGVPRRKTARFNFEQQTRNTQPATGDQNAYVGQYSLIQAIPPHEGIGNTNNTVENSAMEESSAFYRDSSPREDARGTNTSVQNQKPSLVYADVGPLSFKQRRVNADLRMFDDDRVQYVQVDLTRLQETPEPTNVDKCAPIDNILNLDSLLLQIKAVATPKWHEFGKAIGVDDEVLNKCLEYAQEESIIEVCDKWLRNHSGKPTWREVAEALKQIGDQELAFEIENSYKTGKLPKSLEEEPELVQDEMAPPIPPRSAL